MENEPAVTPENLLLAGVASFLEMHGKNTTCDVVLPPEMALLISGWLRELQILRPQHELDPVIFTRDHPRNTGEPISEGESEYGVKFPLVGEHVLRVVMNPAEFAELEHIIAQCRLDEQLDAFERTPRRGIEEPTGSDS